MCICKCVPCRWTVHVCACECHVCTNMHVPLCVRVCLHISSMYLYMCPCAYMYLHVCVLACSYMYLCVYVHVCLCACICNAPVCVCNSVPTCTHMCLHEPVCTYMCLCLYVPTCAQCPPALPTSGVPSWDVTESSGMRPNWVLSPRRCQGGCFRHCPGLPTGNWARTLVPGKSPRAAMSPTPAPLRRWGLPH